MYLMKDTMAEVWAYVFALQTSGAQSMAKKKYKLCLGLVGARYPSELELPVMVDPGESHF